MSVTIYHNPQCSKSRQTLALLRDHGVEPKIVEYLKTPPDAGTLRALVRALGFDSPRQLMRTKEAEYRELGLAGEDDPEKLLAAMAKHPRLIERPVVVKGDPAKGGRAALGRPPEAVLTMLGK